MVAVEAVELRLYWTLNLALDVNGLLHASVFLSPVIQWFHNLYCSHSGVLYN